VYAQVKPVKVESAGSKPSKEAVDLAEGPKSGEIVPPQTKSWFSSLWGSSTKKSVDTSKAKYPDKVGVSRNYHPIPGRSHFILRPFPLPVCRRLLYNENEPIYVLYMMVLEAKEGVLCTQCVSALIPRLPPRFSMAAG